MANYTYDNIVLENKYNSILETLLDINNYMTIDTSLVGVDGDVKRIKCYSVSGQADDVSMGEGNTHSIEVTGSYKDYKVKTTQGKFPYYDEEVAKDSLTIENGLKGCAEIMSNNWTNKAIAEFKKANTYEVVTTDFGFNSFVDAVAKFGEKNVEFGLLSPNTLAKVRKQLKTDGLVYDTAYIRNGYVGSVCGVPLVVSDSIPDDEIYIGMKSAVTAFIKKQGGLSQDRDEEHRKTTIFPRKTAVIALTDGTKLCRIAKAATTSTTITTYTKDTKAIAGACTSGANVEVFVNGVFVASAVGESSAYSVTLDENIVAGDIVKVIARKDGEVSSSATVTVAD